MEIRASMCAVSYNIEMSDSSSRLILVLKTNLAAENLFRIFLLFLVIRYSVFENKSLE